MRRWPLMLGAGVALWIAAACLPDYQFGGGGDAGATDASALPVSARLDPPNGGTFEFLLDVDNSGLPTRRTASLTRPFAIDVLEVTVARYKKWIALGKPRPRDGESLDPNGAYMAAMKWHKEWESYLPSEMPSCSTALGAYGGSTLERGIGFLPATCVTWFEAAAFCAWDDQKRLPTELEWQFAATSRGNNLWYPWTDADKFNIDCPFVVFDRYGQGAAGGGCAFLDSGPATAGASEQGVIDLSGRVFEWVWDIAAAFPASSGVNYSGPADNGGVTNFRVRRGGAFNLPDTNGLLQNWGRQIEFPGTDAYSDLGFRCAKSL